LSWSEYFKEQVTLPHFIRVINWLSPLIGKIEEWGGGKRCLEVGFGTGVLSIYLSHLGYEVTGIDIDNQLIDKAQVLNEQFAGKARFIKQDMFNLPNDVSYDFAFHQGTMEHYDIEIIQKALHAQLKVSKMVIFSVPSKRYGQQDFGDERLFAYDQWMQILREFNVLDSFGFHRKKNRFMSIIMLPLLILNKKAYAEINKRYFSTQLGFVLEGNRLKDRSKE